MLPDQAAFFMGDLNDVWAAVREVERAGFRDCFTGLGVEQAATWPVTGPPHKRGPPQAIDWCASFPLPLLLLLLPSLPLPLFP